MMNKDFDELLRRSGTGLVRDDEERACQEDDNMSQQDKKLAARRQETEGSIFNEDESKSSKDSEGKAGKLGGNDEQKKDSQSAEEEEDEEEYTSASDHGDGLSSPSVTTGIPPVAVRSEDDPSPRKRRRKSKIDKDNMTEEERREERRAANRRSAFESRQRRRILIDDLQQTVQSFARENDEKRREIESLRSHLEAVIRENQHLRLQQHLLLSGGRGGVAGDPTTAIARANTMFSSLVPRGGLPTGTNITAAAAAAEGIHLARARDTATAAAVAAAARRQILESTFGVDSLVEQSRASRLLQDATSRVSLAQQHLLGGSAASILHPPDPRTTLRHAISAPHVLQHSNQARGDGTGLVRGVSFPPARGDGIAGVTPAEFIGGSTGSAGIRLGRRNEPDDQVVQPLSAMSSARLPPASDDAPTGSSHPGGPGALHPTTNAAHLASLHHASMLYRAHISGDGSGVASQRPSSFGSYASVERARTSEEDDEKQEFRDGKGRLD